VKFTIFKNWTTDYNKIPAENAAVEAIDVAGVSVMDVGLEHLADLKYIQSLSFHNCKYITDRGLVNLEHVQETLHFLDMSHCVGITHRGLEHLYRLKYVALLCCVCTVVLSACDCIFISDPLQNAKDIKLGKHTFC
jgi:hypothetical protein